MFITGRLYESDGGGEVILNLRHISIVESIDSDKCQTYVNGKRVILEGALSKWKKLLEATNPEHAGII